jgi:hypothetical protein
MKLKFCLAVMVFVAVIAPLAHPQQKEKPLSKVQIMSLAQAGMETTDLVKLIREHGTDFDLTDDYVQSLRQAGAQEPVIQALRAARPKPLTKDQVLQLLTGHVPSQRAAELVRQHGIDFVPDDAYFDMLRLAGADDSLIAALRAAGEAMTGSLEIGTLPNAEIYIDGQLIGHAGADGQFALRPKAGIHTLSVLHPGKLEFRQTFPVLAGKEVRIVAALADLPGRLFISSTPGAEVTLDGMRWGTTDAAGQFPIPKVAAGTHDLRISAAGKIPYHQNIIVTAGTEQTIEAMLADTGATVNIMTNPGASVSLDNLPRGTANSSGNLELSDVAPGIHEVNITAPGKMALQRRIKVTAGATLSFTFWLAAPPTNPVVPSSNAISFIVMHYHGPQKFCLGPLTFGDGRVSFKSGTVPGHSFDVPISEVQSVKLDEEMAKYLRKKGQPASFFYLKVKGRKTESYSLEGQDVMTIIVEPLKREMGR